MGQNEAIIFNKISDLELLLLDPPHPLPWRPAREEEGVQVMEEGGGVEVRELTTRELVYSQVE